MRKQKPQIDESLCPPGSPEQQLDMCETGSLRGEEQLRRSYDHPNFSEDMSEENREGDEMSGDEHSNGLQGEDSEFTEQESESGLPGDETRLENLRAQRMHLPEEPEPTRSARFERAGVQMKEKRKKAG